MNRNIHLRRCSTKIDVIGVLQNSCSTEYQADCMIKIFEKYQSRSLILVKLQAYSQQLKACVRYFLSNFYFSYQMIALQKL